MTDLHLEQTIAMESPGLSSSAWAGVVIWLSIIKCSPPFIGFIGSSARTELGSHAAAATAKTMVESVMQLQICFAVFIYSDLKLAFVGCLMFSATVVLSAVSFNYYTGWRKN